MNRLARTATAMTSLSLVGLLTSCVGTRVTNAWQAPGLGGAAPRRVLVVAALGNPASRQAVEDALVRELAQAGVSAVPGYTVYAEVGEAPQERLAQVVAETGADAALVCRWHAVRQRLERSWSGSADPETAYRVRQVARGGAWLLGGATLATLWSADLYTDEPGGFCDLAPRYARDLVAALRKAGALTDLPSLAYGCQ